MWCVLATAVMLLLTACGFKPLYQYNLDAAATKNFNSVWIDHVGGSSGYLLRNELIDRFYSQGMPQTARYLLRLDLREDFRNLDIAKDDTATRAQLVQRVRYTLIDRMANNKIIDQATLRSASSYNLLPSVYTTVVTEADARENALTNLAEQIETRVAYGLNRE
jgi:LPS-assembly lipoprotein